MKTDREIYRKIDRKTLDERRDLRGSCTPFSAACFRFRVWDGLYRKIDEKIDRKIDRKIYREI